MAADRRRLQSRHPQQDALPGPVIARHSPTPPPPFAYASDDILNRRLENAAARSSAATRSVSAPPSDDASVRQRSEPGTRLICTHLPSHARERARDDRDRSSRGASCPPPPPSLAGSSLPGPRPSASPAASVPEPGPRQSPCNSIEFIRQVSWADRDLALRAAAIDVSSPPPPAPCRTAPYRMPPRSPRRAPGWEEPATRPEPGPLDDRARLVTLVERLVELELRAREEPARSRGPVPVPVPPKPPPKSPKPRKPPPPPLDSDDSDDLYDYEDEMRVAADGVLYTEREFEDYFEDGGMRWEMALPRDPNMEFEDFEIDGEWRLILSRFSEESESEES
jgi:hypothetical protein